MQTPSVNTCVAVEEPHRNSAAEQNDGRNHEQRRKQAHGELRRAVCHVFGAARVVAHETPSGAQQLQDYRRDQGEPDEDVP
jgi:hypothetical protein